MWLCRSDIYGVDGSCLLARRRIVEQGAQESQLLPPNLRPVVPLQSAQNVVRHLIAVSRHENDIRPETRQRKGKGVNRASVEQVPAEGHFQALQSPVMSPQRVQVTQGLGGMLVAAIPTVDNRDWGVLRNQFGRSLPGMPHDQNVRVGSDDPRRVRKGFTLGRRRRPHVWCGDDATSQALHSGFEGQPGPGAGLVE